MSNFKIALTAIFAISFVVGIVLFASYKAGSGQTSASLVVWGTISNEAFDAAYKNSSLAKDKYITATYVKKDSSSFDTDFVEALANGEGPDIILVRDDSLYKNRNKLFIIPYKSYPERTFKDQFIQEAEIFLRADGVSAVPFSTDPLVMYWNRDIFSNNLISEPPKYWDEFYALVDKMTKRDSSANILQSTVAFGEWRNVTNAKDIIALLLLQAGTPIVSYDKQSYSSAMSAQFSYPIAPGQSALNFYTQFSNPTSASYSWNRSLPSSLNFFLSGNLSMYFGYASEVFSIQQKNPNLNFDVTYVPQIRDTKIKIDFAHMYALAIVKQSKSIGPAFSLINALTEPASQIAFEKVTNLPPVRRDLLASKPADAFRAVFYNSALISRTWVDPDSTATTNIFRDMIESITSGRARVLESLGTADKEIGDLLK